MANHRTKYQLLLKRDEALQVTKDLQSSRHAALRYPAEIGVEDSTTDLRGGLVRTAVSELETFGPSGTGYATYVLKVEEAIFEIQEQGPVPCARSLASGRERTSLTA